MVLVPGGYHLLFVAARGYNTHCLKALAGKPGTVRSSEGPVGGGPGKAPYSFVRHTQGGGER